MAYQVIDLNCPGCGAGISTADKVCKFCRRPIVITSFSDISFSSLEWNKYKVQNSNVLAQNPDNDGLNMSQAMALLKLRLYDDALPYFKKAQMSFESETFFYEAVCLLKGRIPFVASREAQIDKIIEYLNAALMIEPRGIFHYFLAYIKHDYFERKYLNTSPNWRETLQTAVQCGVSQADIQQLAEVLQVEMPECLRV